MSRFLVYVSPAVGHTLPLVPGLLELQRRGHTVRTVVLDTLVDPLADAGLDVVAVSPDRDRGGDHRLPGGLRQPSGCTVARST